MSGRIGRRAVLAGALASAGAAATVALAGKADAEASKPLQQGGVPQWSPAVLESCDYAVPIAQLSAIKDGSVFAPEVHIHIHVSGNVVDERELTDRVQAALRASHERYRGMARSIAEHVTPTDPYTASLVEHDDGTFVLDVVNKRRSYPRNAE